MKPSTPKNIWPEWPNLLGTGELTDVVSLLRGEGRRTLLHEYLNETIKHEIADENVTVVYSGNVGEPVEGRQMEAVAVEGKIKGFIMGSVGGIIPTIEEPSTVLTQAILGQSQKLAELSERLSRIEGTLRDAIKGIEQLQLQQSSVWVPIQSFAPEPYEVLKPFTVVVRPDGEEFEASFFDANLHGSGDTEEEAVSDLKFVMIESFERLSELGDDKLGPAMLKQKRILTSQIRRRG